MSGDQVSESIGYEKQLKASNDEWEVFNTTVCYIVLASKMPVVGTSYEVLDNMWSRNCCMFNLSASVIPDQMIKKIAE